ncbi:unnamed protein product [Calicophoron daubneyi]|uniref:Uncharacterized protein n=1 Tax=Calicophoron daubneyi TaxID=300641 RepID=A0AAV2TYP3_CALDB
MALFVPTNDLTSHVWATVCLTAGDGPSYHLCLLLYTSHVVHEKSISDTNSPELNDLVDSLFHLSEEHICPLIRSSLTDLVHTLQTNVSSDLSRVQSIRSSPSENLTNSGTHFLRQLLTFLQTHKQTLDIVYEKFCF